MTWTRHLRYFVYPRSGNGAWRRNVEHLLARWGLFNGTKVIAVATGPGADSSAEVRAAFAGRDCEFVEMKNDPLRGEAAAFKKLWTSASRHTGPGDVTFYAHAKGVKYDDPEAPPHRWADVMYAACLDRWGDVERAFRAGKLTAGAFRTAGTPWHFSGTFFWFKNAETFARNWHKCSGKWGGVEIWPGRTFDVRESECLFEPLAAGGELYDRATMDDVARRFKALTAGPETPRVVVGTTLAAFAMGREERWRAWTYNAEAVRRSHPDVRYFAAVQVDARGLAPFAPLLDRLREIGGEWWTYSLDDGRAEVTTGNRLRHLVCGQNLVTDYCASDPAVSHLLFMAADCEPPADVLPKLLEVGHPLVAPLVPTYCLRGRPVAGYPFPVEQGMASAAAVLIARSVFRAVRWRHDPDAGLSDDPCLHADALRAGVPTLIRTDLLARHHPEAVGPFEDRYTPESRAVARSV